jgi:hypothetical protein
VTQLPATCTSGQKFHVTTSAVQPIDTFWNCLTGGNAYAQVFTANAQTAVTVSGTAGTGGVTANTLVKLDTDGTYISVAGAEVIFGVANNTASAGNAVVITVTGNASCVAEGTWIAGHYLIAGTTDPKKCLDSGQTSLGSIPSTTRIAGKATQAATDGQTKTLSMYGPGTFGAQSSGATPGGSSGDLQKNNGSSGLAASSINDDGTTVTVTGEPVSIARGTITANTPTLSSTATWNNSGVTFTHWKANVTNTASGATSLLIDMQVGGVSQFNVTRVGAMTITGQMSSAGVSSSADVFAGAASDFRFSSTRARRSSPADGVVVDAIAANTYGMRMQFAAISTIGSGFGASPAVTAGSTDTAGSVDVGTGGAATSGVVNFATTWSSAPFCIVQDSTTAILQRATTTTTAMTITSASAWTANDKIVWHCIGAK